MKAIGIEKRVKKQAYIQEKFKISFIVIRDHKKQEIKQKYDGWNLLQMMLNLELVRKDC